MGFNDKEIVALSGAHSIGRAHKERSGTVSNSQTEKDATCYTGRGCTARFDGKSGVGNPGGKSWTKSWLKFDNAYYDEN